MGIVNHIGSETATGAHIHFKSHKVAHLAESAMRFVEAEKFEVHKSRSHAEGFHRVATPEAQVFRHVLLYIVGRLKVILHNVGDAWRANAHRLGKRFAVRIDYGVVGANIAGYKFFNHILGHMRVVGEDVAKHLLAFNLVSSACAHAHVGFGKERITGLRSKCQSALQAFAAFNLTSSANTALGIIFFHLRFLLDGVDAVGAYAGGDIEVGAQACVGFQPKLVVRFQPIDFAIFPSKIAHCFIHILIYRHVGNVVILGKGAL